MCIAPQRNHANEPSGRTLPNLVGMLREQILLDHLVDRQSVLRRLQRRHLGESDNAVLAAA